jgi:hypothetical protein
LLRELKPVGRARYDSTRACLPGTRTRIIGEITGWPQSGDASEGLLWVHGHAGLGKSSIAASVCQDLDDKKLLAASFFCKRDDPERRDPQRVLATIIDGLAARYPPYLHVVAAAIQEDPQLSSSPIQMQYDKLVENLLRAPTMSNPATSHVVVIDALDECGTQETRRQLLMYLHKLSQLTPWLRFVVTSRPDKDIQGFFDRSDTTKFSERDVYAYDASDDIHAFISKRIADNGELPANAPDLLTESAKGVFIWAQTACEFILSSYDPKERLVLILKNASGNQTYSSLDALYTTTIETSVGDSGKDNERMVQRCLGAIIVCSTRVPLSVDTLSKLLGERAKQTVLKAVVDSLGSVLYTDHSQGNTIRVYHPSFADYMTTPSRSGRFCVDIEQQNTELVHCCLQTMVTGLKFNICQLESSYKRNSDIPDLGERVNAFISLHLIYSCLYWTNHLAAAHKGELETQLREFLLGPNVLYWIEVLSLIGKLQLALSSARELRACFRASIYKI